LTGILLINTYIKLDR